MSLARCRSCASEPLASLVDMGPQPPADLFPEASDPGPDPTWPLVLGQCPRCHLVQLIGDDPGVPEVPLAVESATAIAHGAAQVRALDSILGPGGGRLVREFDSPHGGSWRPELVARGWVATDTGQADLVVDVHGLIHDVDLDAALRERLVAVSPGGHFVIEFHHVRELLRHGQFDYIRHGHTVYLSLIALEAALARHGFRALRADRSAIYGGCLLVVCGCSGDPDASVAAILAEEHQEGLDDPKRLVGLGDRAAHGARSLRAWLEEQRSAGRRVLGYGAPSRAPALLTLSGVNVSLLPSIADAAPGKQGRRTPVTRIPIVSPVELVAAQPDAVLLLTWDLAAEVRAQLAALGLRCPMFRPLPEPALIP